VVMACVRKVQYYRNLAPFLREVLGFACMGCQSLRLPLLLVLGSVHLPGRERGFRSKATITPSCQRAWGRFPQGGVFSIPPLAGRVATARTGPGRSGSRSPAPAGRERGR
jgi:hypothetical protein